MSDSCSPISIGITLHPLTQAVVDAYIAEGWGNMPPAIKAALNNIVLSGRDVAYSFYTDVNGEHQNDLLKGMRLIQINAVTNPLDIIAGEISLDTITGIITSPYADQQHIGTIGWHLDGYGDNTP